MLRVARDLAIQAGDLANTQKAVQILIADFQVDPVEYRLEALEKLVPTASVANIAPLVKQALAMSDEFSQADRNEAAIRAATVSVQAARRTKDVALLKRATVQAESLAKHEEALATVKGAMAILEKSPLDDAANLAVGKYHCFVKRNWTRGLPILALGGSSNLAKLAHQDLLAKTPVACIAAADGWFEEAEQASGLEKSALRRRAYELYVGNSSELTGINAKKVAVRVEALEKEFGPVTVETPKVAAGILHRFVGHSGLAFSPDGRYLCTSDKDGVLHLWNRTTLREIRQFPGHSGTVRGLAFTPDGSRIFSAGNDKTARIWDITSGAMKSTIKIPSETTTLMTASDPKRWFVCSETTVMGIDPEQGKFIKEWDLRANNGEVFVKGLTPDGRFGIVCGHTTKVYVFDLANSDQMVFDLPRNSYTARLTPDGRVAIAGGEDRTIRVWNVANKGSLGEFSGFEGHVYGVAITPDGKRVVATTSEQKAYYWDKNREKPQVFPIQDIVSACTMSPDGKCASLFGRNGVVLLGLPE
jgi:DNA-binding beta-propeller fold protein YncE